jgi:hypothetical protein
LSKSCSDPEIIVGDAVEVEESGPDHIRLADVPDYSAGTLHPCITGTLAPSGHCAPERDDSGKRYLKITQMSKLI